MAQAISQTAALIVLCLGSAAAWFFLRRAPQWRIFAPPLAGVALGLAPQFAFLLAGAIGGPELLNNPRFAASAIVYDKAAMCMREHLAVIKDLPAEMLVPAVIALAIGALALRWSAIVLLPIKMLSLLGSAAFIASMATTFTLAAGNPAWEPGPDAHLRAALREATRDAVALNLQTATTSEPPILDAEELNRFIEALRQHLGSGDPCGDPERAAANAYAARGRKDTCLEYKMRHRFEDAEEKQRRVLAIVLEPAAEEAARGLAAGLLEGTVEGPRDSFTALAELKRQKPPPDQRVRAAQQVATFIATHAIDISFGSIPVIGNLANKYFDIAEEQIAERLVAHLPIEAMFGLAHTFSMRLHQTLQPERTQLLRIMIKPAVAADADERFAKAERMTAERMQRLPAGPEKPGPKIEAFER